MDNQRPRLRIIDKKRQEATTKKTPGQASSASDKNFNLGVPNNLRHGSQEAFQMLARKIAAMGGR